MQAIAVVSALVAVAGAIAAAAAAGTFAGKNGRIVFERFTGPDFTSQIATVNPNGEDLRVLTDFKAGAVEPDFSPRGGRIVFDHFFKDGRPGALFSTRAGGEKLKRLSSGCTGQCLEDYEPAYSPDGREIVFSRAYGPIVDDSAARIDLMLMRRNGSDVETIMRSRGLHDGGFEPHSAQWSPDGQRLVFMMLDVFTPSMRSAIFTLELESRDLDRITPFRLNAGNPDWSPDGRRIVFNSSFEGQAAANLYTVAPDGSALRRLTDNPRNRFSFEPTWSPSGRQLGFVTASAHVPPHLVKMRVGGRDRHRVTTASDPGVHPDWGSRP